MPLSPFLKRACWYGVRSSRSGSYAVVQPRCGNDMSARARSEAGASASASGGGRGYGARASGGRGRRLRVGGTGAAVRARRRGVQSHTMPHSAARWSGDRLLLLWVQLCTMASSAGTRRCSCSPVGSGWRCAAQPYDVIATGSCSSIVERRSSASPTVASGGTSCHGGMTPSRSGITSRLASLSSHEARSIVVCAMCGSSSAPPQLYQWLPSGRGSAASRARRASSAASSASTSSSSSGSPLGPGSRASTSLTPP